MNQSQLKCLEPFALPRQRGDAQLDQDHHPKPNIATAASNHKKGRDRQNQQPSQAW